MNSTILLSAVLFFIILISVIIAVIFAHRSHGSSKPAAVVFWILGILLIAGGIYLYPATMWRNFTIGFWVAGALLVILGIYFFIKKNSKMQ